jgi:4-hydroxybenzoate polyprenyltransferase
MKPWLHLARISNLPTVWTNVTAAWLLAGGGLADARLYWLILAGSLLYTGGMILNDAADVKFDREHRQERPLPSGQVSVLAAWSVGMMKLVLGAGLSIGLGANVLGTAALVAAILFYDLYHKPWAGSVIVMGSCRMFLYLMVGSVLLPPDHAGGAGWLHEKVLPYAVVMFCYVVGITFAARLEHKDGKLAVVSWILSFALLGAPLIAVALISHGQRGDGLDFFIIGPFVWCLMAAFRHLDAGGPAIGKAVGILLAGIVIVDALAICTVSMPLALAFVALAPLLRLWQRWVAAT